MDTKQVGNFGENIACEYLKQKGYKILDRNYVPKWLRGVNKKEIDIIARKPGKKSVDFLHRAKTDTICFVEVKALSGNNIFNPEDKVNYQKQRKIIQVAENWLMDKKYSPDTKWQVDVISVRVDLENKKAKIKHFENI